MTLPVQPAASRGLPASGSGSAGAIRRALPPVRTAFFGALIWGSVMGASALANLLADHWLTPEKIRFVSLLFFAGGAAAFPVGLFFARLVSNGRGREPAFAALIVCLFLFTVAFTAGLFALQYRLYYAEWHAPAFSFVWFLQLAFTGAGALYQFAVLGIRLYFPIGFVALFVAALWFVRQPR